MNLNSLKIFAFIFILIPQIFSQVISINEFHAKPISGQIEFVELLHSGSNPIDLQNWIIADNSTGKTLPVAIVQPGELVIVADDSTIYPLVPAGTHYLIPSGGLPSLNNSGDKIKISDSFGTVIDSLIYDSTWDVEYVFSTEKVRPELSSNLSDNWKASKDSLGTPGRPNSVLPLAIDGEIVSANTVVNPSLIGINEKTYISVDIANIGITSFSGNILIEQNSINVGSQPFGSINVLDTSTVTIETSILSSGEVKLDITLEIVGDLDLSNNTDTVVVSVKHEPYIFLLNEFHAQPVDDQIEFVELIHRGSTPIDINNWRIADGRNGTTYRLPTAIVQPGEFVVIATDSSMYQSIPIGTHYLLPTGGLPALNNSGDGVRIFDPYDTLIDSLTFDSNWDITSGYSTEKILPQLSSEQSANWRHSVAVNKMTPGLANSVIPYNIDGAIQDNITYNPTFPKPGELVTAMVPIQNVGIQSINGTITATLNNHIVGSTITPNLSMGETATINIPLSNLPSGRHQIIFEFSVANDENLSNNSAMKKVGVSFEAGIVKFNEFHALPSDNAFEFVELVSSRSIVIDGWRIADKSTNNLLPITYIENGDYIVIASDTSLKPITNPDAKYLIPYGGLPSLNNSGDNIYLYDMNHNIIDSLAYGTGWPVVTDTSTEKLRPYLVSNDPINWKKSTATIGITPGYVNSNYLIDYDGEIIADSVYHAPQFPKSNETIQLNVPITNHGAQPISGNVNVYENNIQIGTINFNDIARRDTLKLNMTLPPMSSGIHPLQIDLEVADDQNLINNSATDTIYISYEFGSVLINEFLPRPTSLQAEFVELVSFDNVDLTNWSIADKTNTLHHFNGGDVASDKFIVLSEDIAFATIILPEATFVEVSDFPSLNNYGDALYLQDFTGTIIDSLVYTTWWNLATGKSTEKIHPEFVSNDSTGWKVSTDSTGMTPGRPNSVVAKNIDGAILSELIISAPDFPESTDEISLTIPVANFGLKSISGELIAENDNQVFATSNFNELGVGDTLFVQMTLQPFASGIHDIKLHIDIENDENLENNIASISVGVSYNFGVVTINEFLADPEDPLSEFVELVVIETVDLTDWAISDSRKELETFSIAKVEAGDYIVLSEDSSLTSLLPPEAIFASIKDFPSLNNSGDGIFLYDFTGKIIDSLNFNKTDWPLKSGVSTEKLFPDYISGDATRWKVCTDTSNSTIGRTNSILLQNFNGAILSELTNHYPEYPHPSESISFNIAIKNNGINEISGEVTVLYNDNELGSGSFNSLVSEDTTFISFNIEPLPSGNNQFEIKLDIDGDMNTSDNQLEYNIFVSYPFGDVVFNEFLAQPDSTQVEFVEIISFNDIYLKGWAISDNTLKQYYFDEVFASANQPVVIASDSLFVASLSQGTPAITPIGGWPTLNNTSDGLFLYDPTGAIIDSLNYDENWPITDGRSTEKFRPEFESFNMNRWGISVNAEAMTPGLENSLHFDEIPHVGAIAFEANPFSPNGDGVDDELLIQYKLPYEQGIIKLQIFDMTGRNIATPYWNVYFPQEGILKWDGKREDGNNARIGIYIVKLLAKDPATGKTWEKVKTVVLAKQL